MPSTHPFHQPGSTPGHGSIHLALLPPSTPRLQTVQYQYPLKLISPDPLRVASVSHHDGEEEARLIHSVYLLTYGGGLVAGDSVNLSVRLDRTTRLILLTQGSTKTFKSPGKEVVSQQCMIVDSAPDSALCYLPDPVQPFRHSRFEQRQIYNLEVDETAYDSRHNGNATLDAAKGQANICVLDWVCNGRPANGENWSFDHYASRNEVFLRHPDGKRKLLLRDNLLLESPLSSTQSISRTAINGKTGDLAGQMEGLAVYGTLILRGPLFRALGRYFLDEFKALPRLGGRHWENDDTYNDGNDSNDNKKDLGGRPDTVSTKTSDASSISTRRALRSRQESKDNLLWSAASVRGCTVVKLGANSVEGGKRWLRSMLSDEGTIVREFGERALLCLK